MNDHEPHLVDLNDPATLYTLGREFFRTWWRGFQWGIVAGLVLTILLALAHTWWTR